MPNWIGSTSRPVSDLGSHDVEYSPHILYDTNNGKTRGLHRPNILVFLRHRASNTSLTEFFYTHSVDPSNFHESVRKNENNASDITID